MARPARSVSRTARVLEFMGAHPRERFTLTEIARALELNKASCHAMLMELASEDLLVRDAVDKTYTLGAALVDLATAAQVAGDEVLDIARAELLAIHDELGVSCVATALRGFDTIVVARRDTERPLIDFSPVGHAVPIVPPSGQEFMAWAPRATVDKWLDHALPRSDKPKREAYYRRLDHVRRVGYRISVLDEARALRRLLNGFVDLPGARELRDAVGRVAFGPFTIDDYEPKLAIVTRFKAPIFGSTGRVELAFTMSQFPPNLPTGELRDYVLRLLAGTERVTHALHGFAPTSDWSDLAARNINGENA
ncbi:IclR family transcriptional regulator [Nocardia sp. NPDC052278]|uniref:IclR family transcriptional regulator n=1 Tax=unclassified Nocardia TaxID=2637762 RepID=UPI0036B6951E